MYVESQKDKSGMAKTLVIRRAANTAYARLLPRVYKTPVKSTCRGDERSLPINDMAATFVASGQGLIEVRIPSQTAVSTAVVGRITRAS